MRYSGGLNASGSAMLAICLLLIPVAFAIALPATAVARALGHRLNALDGAGVTGQVKAPPRRVPNTGGIGIFLGVAVTMGVGLVLAWSGWVEGAEWLPAEAGRHLPGLRAQAGSGLVLLGCVTVLHIVGLVDDRRPLGAMPKLVVMLGVSAVAVMATDSRLLTALDALAGGEWASIAITVAWIVVITNAFNFLDNMDGLSGGLAAIAASCFLTMALVNSPPQWFVAAALAALVGSLLGFLVFNFPWRARERLADSSVRGGASVFMGDGGSLVVGFLLAVLSVRLTYAPASPGSSIAPHVLIAPLVVLAIPLYDFCSVVLIRLRQGKSPFVGDLQHFSHRLCQHGLTQRSAVLVIYGCAAVTGIGAIALPRLEPWQGWLVGVQALLVLGVLALYEWSRVPRGEPREASGSPGGER